METNKLDLTQEAIAAKYGMTSMEAVERNICMGCKQQVDGFHAIVSLFCMIDYLDTGLCATCRNQHAQRTS